MRRDEAATEARAAWVRGIAWSAVAVCLLSVVPGAMAAVLPPPARIAVIGRTAHSLTIAWSRVPGASSYRVLRGDARRSTTTTRTHTFHELACGTRYRLGVRARAAGRRATTRWRAVRTAACSSVPPAPPRGLAVAAATAGSLTLTWRPQTGAGSLAYAVDLNRRSVADTPVPAYTFDGLGCGTAYTLSVTAFDRADRRSAAADLTGRTAACSDPCSGVSVPPGGDLSQTVAATPAGTTFCLAGTYHLSAPVVPKDGDSFSGAAGAVVDGAAPLTAWTASGSTWTAAGPTTPSLMRISMPSMRFPQARYQDDLLMDGAPLWKVGVEDGGKVIGDGPGAVGPGDYFVNYDSGRIILGSDPAGHDLELASVSRGFTGYARDVRIRGLVIQGFRSTGIFMPGKGYWLAEDNEVRANHAVGIKLQSNDRAISNSVHDNGDDGLAGAGAKVVVAGNQVSRNDAARVELVNGDCWDGAGAKFVLTRDLVVVGNSFHDNLCHGLWLDINNDHSLIQDNVSSGNLGDGILHEISYHATIDRNTVADNADFGIDITSSPGDLVTQNTVTDNVRGGIFFFNEGRPSDPAAFGRLVVRNLKVRGNTVTNDAADELTGGVDYTGTPGVFRSYGNRFQGNTYHLVTAAAVSFQWAGRRMTAREWQAAGNDTQGTFQTP